MGQAYADTLSLMIKLAGSVPQSEDQPNRPRDRPGDSQCKNLHQRDADWQPADDEGQVGVEPGGGSRSGVQLLRDRRTPQAAG